MPDVRIREVGVNELGLLLSWREEVLLQARARFEKEGIRNVQAIQGDVGAIPFADGSFDTVLSMNGVHVFPDKEKAWSEMRRVLKTGGSLVACFCIKGESRISDWLMHRILSRKGWFTPPFETFASLKIHDIVIIIIAI